MLEKAGTPIQPCLLEQAVGGDRWLSIRGGHWKYLDHQGSGGNNYNAPELKPFAFNDTTSDAPSQLCDLCKDPSETTNFYFDHQELVKELNDKLDQSKRSAHSAPKH